MKKKRRTSTPLSKKDSGIKEQDRFSGIKQLIERCDPYFPWAVAVIYFLYMGYLTLRYHNVAGLGVETDFLVELVPQAKKLLAGRFSPVNYGPKGPVYSFLLAFMYLVVRDYFYAGLILNLLAASIFLVTLFFLIKKVFNIMTARIVMIAVAFNYVFQHYTYNAGSDLPFMAISILSMYFLFRSNRSRDLIFSAIFGCMAFLTRYNGAFIVLGTVPYLALFGESVRERMKRIGLWIGVFILLGLPWFIPNWKVLGSPVYNDNYVNVMMEFYGLEKEGSTYENWRDNLPKDFTGLGDIIMYDPIYFVKRVGKNIVTHFTADIKYLLGWRLGIFVVLGLVLFWFIPDKEGKLMFFLFGLFYFLILTLVFYNERFSLFLLVFYTSFAAFSFTSHTVYVRLRRFSRLPAAILILVILSYIFTTPSVILAELINTPPYLKDFQEIGLVLGRIEPDKSKKIIARTPNVAYYAGLDALMFPEHVRSVGELVEFCREQNVDYILYSGVEISVRPYVQDLIKIDQKLPGLEIVFHNRFGVIYRVLEQ